MRVLFHNLKDTVSRAATAGGRLGATVRGPVLWLTVCGALLVAAIFAGTIMMVGEFRERALANASANWKIPFCCSPVTSTSNSRTPIPSPPM
jgi:hypothetical protein